MNAGYECRTCGYVPDDRVLSSGTCPFCVRERLYVRETLPAQLDALPLGSSIQVLNKPRYDSRSGAYVESTLYLWTKVLDAHGNPAWCAQRGRTTFYDAAGAPCTVDVQARVESRLHDPSRMPTASVVHFTTGEMTYGARYIVHDVTPKPLTHKDIIRMIFLEDMGWQEAA